MVDFFPDPAASATPLEAASHSQSHLSTARSSHYSANPGPSGGLSRAHSAPMMYYAGASPQASTWYATGSGPMPVKKTCWRPLGATWREWESMDHNAGSRGTPVPGSRGGGIDDRRGYVDGTVPHWGKEVGIRVKGLLEHELTWAYYRMRRHEKHPQRKAVGEFLAPDALNEKMRFGVGTQFQFWRDLRPPFSVLQASRVDNGQDSLDSTQMAKACHPDGELYDIQYECAIEYFAEHLMGISSDAGTHNNKVCGIAQVRIPNNFPHKRPLHILSWGQPTLNPPDDMGKGNKKGVAPEESLPIATELGISPQSDRMQRCIKACKEAQSRIEKRKLQVKVPELQRLLLGPHASLPRLAKMEADKAAQAEMSKDIAELAGRSSASSIGGNTADPQRVRRHRIFTPAVGFVSYNG